MRQQWTKLKVETLSLSQICIHINRVQNWKTFTSSNMRQQWTQPKNFHFITVNTTGKTFTFLNKEKERESSPYWSLAISSVTRSHGARLTNQGLLRHNFHFSGRKSKNQNIPSFHRLEYGVSKNYVNKKAVWSLEIWLATPIKILCPCQ